MHRAQANDSGLTCRVGIAGGGRTGGAAWVCDQVHKAQAGDLSLSCHAGPGSLEGGAQEVLQGVWPLFLHPRLSSTRALELFRNQASRRSGSRGYDLRLRVQHYKAVRVSGASACLAGKCCRTQTAWRAGSWRHLLLQKAHKRRSS